MQSVIVVSGNIFLIALMTTVSIVFINFGDQNGYHLLSKKAEITDSILSGKVQIEAHTHFVSRAVLPRCTYKGAQCTIAPNVSVVFKYVVKKILRLLMRPRHFRR